jgi:hypothetical protein
MATDSRTPIVDGTELLKPTFVPKERHEIGFFYAAMNDKGFAVNIVVYDPEKDRIQAYGPNLRDYKIEFANGDRIDVPDRYLWAEKRVFTVKVKGAAAPAAPAPASDLAPESRD